jgi:hypothetical protein
MAEGSSGATGTSAGATSQGQAGEGTAQQSTPAANTGSENTQEKATTEKDTETVEKLTDINTKEPKKEKTEKPEEPTKEPKEEEPKHKYHDRLTKAFPDRKFEKPEDYDSALDEHLTNLEGYQERGTVANKKLIALFDSEPEVGQLVRDMADGATFREALARHISPDELTAVEGDPDYEGWTKNKTAREESLAKRKERETQREKDLTSSQEAMEAFAKENNMDEDAAQAFYTKIDEMVGAINSGKITKEALLAMQRAFNYETDIAKAKEESALAERNKQIIVKKETPEKQGDGLPRPTRTTTEEPKKPEPTHIDKILERIKSTTVL